MTISNEEEIVIQKMLITAEDYQLMGKVGIFENKPRVELIDGEIHTMSPFTPNHNSHVDKISAFFNAKLYGKANVRTQGSIRTDEHSEPEPDITILKYNKNFYNKKQAGAKDTLLVIEVAVFTVKKDRTIKKKKYASVGIPEYWIVIPQKGLIEVYKHPMNGKYAKKSTFKITSKWKFEPFDLVIKGKELLIE